MKTIFILLLFTSISFATIHSNDKANQILEKFLTVCKSIEQLEYNIQRIDTFSNGDTRTVNGNAFISRMINDKKFGYYFFADNYELHWQNIYDGINSFQINTEKKTYKFIKLIKGSPGHQLVMRIADLIFFPDKRYNRIKMTNETQSSYTIELIFDNEPVEDFKKIIVIDKNTFLPIKYEFGGIQFGNRYSHQFIISDLKINDKVTTSIEKSKLGLTSFIMVEDEKEEVQLSLVGINAFDFMLPELFNQKKLFRTISDKVTLLDFWEVWCGYCIKSMPEVQKLSTKYIDELSVIGIVSESPENAKKVVKKNNLTFKNLIGNNEIKQKYGVNSFPRYFLIDKKGKVRNEYFGFSKKIETDIIELIKKH